MAITLEDMKPNKFTLEIVTGDEEPIQVRCNPPQLYHGLYITKLGNIFIDPSKYSKDDLKKAQNDFMSILEELSPEFKGVMLSVNQSILIINQIMEQIEPEDSKELKKRNVSFGESDPKVKGAGS